MTATATQPADPSRASCRRSAATSPASPRLRAERFARPTAVPSTRASASPPPPDDHAGTARPIAASLIVVTAVCAGCMPGTSRGPPSGPHPAGRHAAVITVGSFDFPESMLLADIYGDALKAKGFPVRILPNLGSRELVDPALMSGLIQVVPEYAGSALQFISLGRLSATSDVMATNKALAELTAGEGVVAGAPGGRAERQRHRRPPGDRVPVSPPVHRRPGPGRAAAGFRRPARMPWARLLPAWAEAEVRAALQVVHPA